MTSYYKFKNLDNNFTYCIIGNDLFNCLMKGVEIQPDKTKRIMLGTICEGYDDLYNHYPKFFDDVNTVHDAYRKNKLNKTME